MTKKRRVRDVVKVEQPVYQKREIDFNALFIIGCFITFCVSGGLLLYLHYSTYATTIEVTSLEWQHVQPVEMFKVVHQDTLKSDMPSDAYNVDEYTTTTYIKAGNVNIPITNYHARYDVNRWVWDHDLTVSGSPHDEMVWPSFTPNSPDGADWLGEVRAGTRREVLYVHFVTQNHEAFTYTAPDMTTWQTFGVEQRYGIDVNRLEEPQWNTLKRIGAL